MDTKLSNINLEETNSKMPALFVGHGSPMNAIEDNEFSQKWREVGQSLPRPAAILTVSAHWETRGTWVTAMPKPRTIHDFGGFPRQLFECRYPAVGSPELARLVEQTVQLSQVKLDQSWGLDHGTWSVLVQMFPQADIPVVQLSLDMTRDPSYHYALGQELQVLRNRGVLVVGSGNIVHNLGLVSLEGGSFNHKKGYDWAIEFDEVVKDLIVSGEHGSIVNYWKLGQAARLSVPTAEHFLPLLYILGIQDNDDQLSFFNDELVAGSLSMRSILLS